MAYRNETALQLMRPFWSTILFLVSLGSLIGAAFIVIALGY